MTYTPPDLSLDVVLQPQAVAPQPPLDIVMCSPKANDIVLSIDSSVTVMGDISLTAHDVEQREYAPPSLSTTVILGEQLAAPILPLNVVMCAPFDDGSEPRYITIDSAVVVQSELLLNVERFVTGINIDVICDINPQAEIVASYDSNVFRGAQLDVSSNLQYSKLQGMDKSGSFENSKFKAVSGTDSKEAANLLTTDSQAQFEANIKLETSEQSLSEQSKLVGTSSKHQGEYHKFLGLKNTLKSESAKLVGKSDWLSFEAMLARQTQRKVQGEYSYLDAIMRQTSSDYNRLVGYQYRNLIETAKLPSWFVGYVPYPLWQTVILKQQLAAPTLPLDVTLCAPKSQSPRTKLSIAQSVIGVYGYLVLTAKESDGTEPQPQTGVIFVTNSVSLTRSDDGREIVLNSFNISSDNNSFGWSFNASLPFTELNKVNILNEEFVSVDLNVNGFLWRFILDACDDSVQFNSNNLNIKGQSRSMLLTSPYFDARSYKFQEALSSRQIAESELNRDSQLTGFSLDWNLIEANGWNVPADVYSYIDKTPINSLQHIANSVGGFVNTHPNQDVIKMLSHYPVASWDWETLQPEITLTESIITSMSRKRNRRPNYNGVVVSGEHSNSVSVFASRTGSDGGYRPSMITNNLITEQSAGIERAKVELSRSGDMAEIDLSSPLIKELGILYPSDFIRIIDSESWIGIVRGVSITGSIGSSRDIKIEQKLKIERNLNGA